jgi:hypothetical protein
MVNGPKKNKMIFHKKINKQQEMPPSPQIIDNTTESTVYDRLYNSRSSKERKRLEDNK